MGKVKKYYLTVTEECVMNARYKGFRGGRAEVLHPDHEYAVIEFRLFMPARMFEAISEAIEGKELTEFEMKHFRIDIDGGRIFKNGTD